MAEDNLQTACSVDPGELCGDIGSLETTAGQGRVFEVKGMDCANEATALQKVVGPLVGGAEHLSLDVINGRMTVRDSARKITDAAIIKAVRKTGMSAQRWSAQDGSDSHAADLARQRLYTFLSGLSLTLALLWHVAHSGLAGALHIFEGHGAEPVPPVETLGFALAIVFGARYVAPKAWAAARRLSPDMNVLMVVAVAGAVLIHQYFEAATVAFFFSLSLTLESWSVGRARNAVARLLDLAPPTALVLRGDGTQILVRAADIRVGQRFIVRAGDRIALDGEVVEGESTVNQAPITGESAAVPKCPGDEVFAGTINGEGTLVVRATKAASDTVLARIIKMVSEAHARRAPVEQWVAKFARRYTPAVMGLALLIAIVPPLVLGGAWQIWFYNALVLLVIACPCALVISTPVSIVASLASAARNGVLIKGGAYIEAPSKLAALALDKTGTLTKGEPEVAALYTLNGNSETKLLAIAAALEARSTHPLARAILARAKKEGLPVRPADEVAMVPGRGMTGKREGAALWLGSPLYAAERGVQEQIPAKLLAQIEARGETVAVVGAGDQVLGLIALADAIRDDARATIADLHALDVKRLVMLTGDNERAARAVAQAVGIDEVHAGLMPEDKVRVIEELAAQYPVVAMVGDGVNDAPAMARASFAIAMGAAGSDAAIETADIALMTDDIAKLPWLVRHARRTMSIIRQNIALALAVKALFMALAFAGMASMWGAITADVGVSLLVVFNALRLLHGTGSVRAADNHIAHVDQLRKQA